MPYTIIVCAILCFESLMGELFHLRLEFNRRVPPSQGESKQVRSISLLINTNIVNIEYNVYYIKIIL